MRSFVLFLLGLWLIGQLFPFLLGVVLAVLLWAESIT